MASTTDLMTSAFSNVSSNIVDTIMGVLPIALGVLGLSIAIYFGVKFFKRITSG